MAEETDETLEVLFHEPGSRWRWTLLGPLAGLAMVGFGLWSKVGPNFVIAACMAVAVSFFLGLQIYAARIHASVTLTSASLRQGAETLDLSQVRWMYPPSAAHICEQARPLGELKSIPKGRKIVGLRLTEGRRVQAWARRDEKLRAELAMLVPGPPAGMNLGDDPESDPERRQW